MKTNQKGIDLIKSKESLSLVPYLCPAKIPTIGWGSTYYPDGKKVSLSDPEITKEKADSIFNENLKSFEKAVEGVGNWNENEFSALVCFAYNCGTKKLLPGSTMGDAITTGDRQKIAEAFLVYNKATIDGEKKELRGLTERRILEKNLFLS